MLTKEQTNEILDTLDSVNVQSVTFQDRSSEYAYNLTTCDSDWITFHKGDCPPRICDKLEVCDYDTTETPIYKDWYMTTNYHS